MDADALWAESAWRMHQLHAATQWLRETRPSGGGAFSVLLRLVRAMEALRAFVDTTLLRPVEAFASGLEHATLRDAARVVEAVSEAFEWQSPSRETFTRERAAHRQRELGALKALLNGREATCSKLCAVLTELREREESRAFHRALLLDVRNADRGDTQPECSYSSDNFAYGSTPFDSWARVCGGSAIQRAVEQWDPQRQSTDREELVVTTPIVVVGSSSGSLVFSTAALLGHACTGIEILPFLHGVALELMETYKPANCTFVQADVLSTTLCGARLVVLTSQCWDDDLYDRVLLKLEKELDTGSLVVDYRDGLSRSKRFGLSERVENVRVSWNPTQTFFLYERIQNK